jgi:hypothetical protein
MVGLRLVGLSEDRQRLVLADPAGQEFTVAVDDRLRAALRGDRARLGQLEIQMDSALRPRDIQARIRAGDSPEAVAEVAQVPVEKIMAYAVPVLAEREHIAHQAQRCALRRGTSAGPGLLLGDAVAERLRSRDADPEAVSWDAWRRDDGKWTVTVTHGALERSAAFVFDALGRYSVSDDDEARWLAGESADDEGAPPVRRLAAVADEDPPDDDLTAVVDAVRDEERSPGRAADSAAAPDAPASRPPSRPASRPAEIAANAAETPADEEPARRGRKTRSRASVPSWDEIMFGRTKE